LDSIKSGFTQIIYPRSYSKTPQQQQAHPAFHQTQRIWILQSLKTLDSTYVSSVSSCTSLNAENYSQLLQDFKETREEAN